MDKKVIWIMLVVAGIIGFSACKHRPPESPLASTNNNNGNNGTDTTGSNNNGSTDTTAVVTCDPDTVYFVQDVLPIFQANCASSGCHSGTYGAEGVRLDTYQHIMSTGHIHPGSPGTSRAYEYMVTNGENRMPPYPAAQLPSATTNLIYTWIMQGALNNSCDASGGCDTTNVTFSGNINPIMQTYCVSCHSGSYPSGGISLSTYAQISNQALNGSLYSSVSNDGTVVPMPYQSASLASCKVDQIRIWIQAGAPNN